MGKARNSVIMRRSRTQFHPEVDYATLVERLTVFKAQYTDDDGHLDRVLAAAEETPHSNQLLQNFVDRVLR